MASEDAKNNKAGSHIQLSCIHVCLDRHQESKWIPIQPVYGFVTA